MRSVIKIGAFAMVAFCLSMPVWAVEVESSEMELQKVLKPKECTKWMQNWLPAGATVTSAEGTFYFTDPKGPCHFRGTVCYRTPRGTGECGNVDDKKCTNKADCQNAADFCGLKMEAGPPPATAPGGEGPEMCEAESELGTLEGEVGTFE